MIIGLTGLAQSGKDSTANVLVDKYGFEQISFAEPLKQISYDIDPLITNESVSERGVVTPAKHLAELVDEFGWDVVKTTYPEARRFLQRIGTEGLRKNVDNNFWVNLAISRIRSSKERGQQHFVISDMRFVNEHYQIDKAELDYFEAWRILRDGLTVMNHASELELNDIPVQRHIDNNGTLEDLENIVNGIVAELNIG